MSSVRLSCVWLVIALGGLPAVAGATELETLQQEFQAYSGARLVFARQALPPGTYHEIMPALTGDRAVKAARIALFEIRKYPKGFLGQLRLEAIGIFAGCASPQGDGYREWDAKLGGYRYYGIWSGRAVAAAYYTDEQLPLTLHHEVFHHVDAAGGEDAFASDDARFGRAKGGTERYAALRIAAADLQALKRTGRGRVLREAVSDYAAKSPGEDQAETARYLMSALPDALVQMAESPELAGSQRMLHLLAEYRAAVAQGGPDARWWVAVALGRTSETPAEAARVPAPATLTHVALLAGDTVETLRKRIQPLGHGTELVVWGSEDHDGVNWTLRGDLANFAAAAKRLAGVARATGEAEGAVAIGQLQSAKLLARYYAHIAGRWQVTAGTKLSFDSARTAMLGALPGAWQGLGAVLGRLPYAELLESLADDGRPLFAVALRTVPAAAANRYLDKVDEEVTHPLVRAAIRAVQPATARFANGGSGVNLTPDGLVLTAAHVPDKLGAVLRVKLPDGRVFRSECVALDHELDLALMQVEGAEGLPFAPLASRAPAVGTRVVVIGQPGSTTPDGEPTGYQPFHVSTGEIRGFLPNILGPQQLGRTKHDAWTYWGHSGSPLFNEQGAIVALHNSWDSQTAMRHAVPHEAIVQFLEAHHTLFAWGR